MDRGVRAFSAQYNPSPLSLPLRHQFFSAIEQRLQIGLEGFRHSQQGIKLRVAQALLDFLQVSHANVRPMRNFFLRRTRAQRFAPFANGPRQTTNQPILCGHPVIVHMPRPVDHDLYATVYRPCRARSLRRRGTALGSPGSSAKSLRADDWLEEILP